MTSVLDDIRKELDIEHPEIREQIDQDVIVLSPGRREKLLDEWAENVFRAAESDLRAKRDALLAASDWTQTPDAPVDANAWASYRQALRDLPENTPDPRGVEWPEPPK